MMWVTPIITSNYALFNGTPISASVWLEDPLKKQNKYSSPPFKGGSLLLTQDQQLYIKPIILYAYI